MKHMIHRVKALVMGLALVGLLAANARAVSVTWAGATTDTGFSSDFNDGTMLFSGFTANQLTSISGDAIFHSHGSSTTVTIDIHLNGSWVNLWSFLATGSGDFSLSGAVGTPISFPSGTVDGIRLFSNPNIDQTYHNFGGNNDIFNFDNVAVPEGGSTLALLAGAAIALAGIRRKMVAA